MGAIMDTSTRMIEVERKGNILILTPRRDLRELEYPEIEVEQEELLRQMEADPTLKGVVVDFGRTDYFGSTALGMLTRLWQHAQKRNGRLALCNVSAHERDILAVTGLIGFWRICSSREEAMNAVNNSPRAA
jgi:anti-anti-sigma factor